VSLTLDLAAYVLRLLPPHELPEMCLRALEEGHESLSLAALAGMTAGLYDPWEAKDLLARALRELGIELPTEREAAEIVIDDTVQRALRGAMTPEDATQRVRDAYFASGGDVKDAKLIGDSLDVSEVVSLGWMYTEVGVPWGPTREELDRDALEGFRAIAERRGLVV
jgi:hypothetical protein